MRSVLVILGILASFGLCRAQYVHRETEAVFTEVPPKLDGLLNDVCWDQAAPANDFVMISPRPGTAMRYDTKVYVVYTHEALYIGIYNYDNQPDSILKQLTGRDGDGNSDYCGMTFGCYRDGINGFTFAVSPAGEQFDARNSQYGEDASWNAVWDCHTKVVEDGWIAEFQIPFAALRFPDAEEQVWDINFFREVRRHREKGFWRGVDPLIQGFMNQMGVLKGIKGIKPPKRIFLYPYASGYVDATEQDDGSVQTSLSYNGGLDMKLGLGEAFTLDATLIPDFGQTISDQLILNLTPFEIQFTDNRAFFLEGTELFSKGGIFYSRRVGGTPVGYFDVYGQLNDGEEVVSNPGESQMINAVKFSGRNRKGLGIGVFNGITAETHAVVQDSLGNKRNITTAPLSNYNVLVFDQNLPNNSYFALINTNVMRNGEWYDANVSAYEFVLRNKKNSYSLTSGGSWNRKYSPAFREMEDIRDGYSHNLGISKTAGNFNWSASYWLQTDTYDPNDLGFLSYNNTMGAWLSASYNIYEPFGRYNNMWSNVYLSYSNLYNPREFTDLSMGGELGLNTRKFLTYSVNVNAQPVRGYDFFEPRVDGRYSLTYRYVDGGGWISSDYRKRLAIDFGTWMADYENEGRYKFNWRIAPRFRVNDHLMFIYVYSQQNHYNDVGFATHSDSGDPIFGTRDVISHTNVLTTTYAFNPFMNLSCRIRHYWGYSTYSRFHGLAEDGSLTETDFDGFGQQPGEGATGSDVDRNFNSFTVDLFYRWTFRPGSELILGWKNAIIRSDFGAPIAAGLMDDLEYTFRMPQSNSISLRIVYFLDYRLLTRQKGEAITRSSLQ